MIDVNPAPEPIHEPANNIVEAPIHVDIAAPVNDTEEPVAGEPVPDPDVVVAGGTATAVEDVDGFDWEQLFPPTHGPKDHPVDHGVTKDTSGCNARRLLSPTSHATSLTMPDFVIPEIEGASFWDDDEEVQDENGWLIN